VEPPKVVVGAETGLGPVVGTPDVTTAEVETLEETAVGAAAGSSVDLVVSNRKRFLEERLTSTQREFWTIPSRPSWVHLSPLRYGPGWYHPKR
jgi:hypothetical protein